MMQSKNHASVRGFKGFRCVRSADHSGECLLIPRWWNVRARLRNAPDDGRYLSNVRWLLRRLRDDFGGSR